MIEVDEVACILPWRGVHTDIKNRIAPCNHMSLAGLDTFIDNSKSFADNYNNDFLKSVRRDFSQNKTPSVCAKCVNKPGIRTIVNSKYTPNELLSIVRNTNADGSVDDVSVGYIHLADTNTCNLTCRGCDTFSSSAWGAKLPNERIIASDKYRNMNSLEGYMPDVRYVSFIGGEPFLMTEQKQLIEYFVESEQAHKIGLDYFTNGTVSDNAYARYLKSVWCEFDTVHFTFSVDGYGKMAEYTRQGLNWDTFVTNYNEFKNNPDVTTQIKVAVGNSNVWHVPSMVKSLINDGMMSKEGSSIKFGPIKRIKGGLITDIPFEVKPLIEHRFIELRHWLESNTTWPEKDIRALDKLVELMYSNDTFNVDEVRANIGKLDDLFGTSFYDVEPEYAKMLLG